MVSDGHLQGSNMLAGVMWWGEPRCDTHIFLVWVDLPMTVQSEEDCKGAFCID